MRKCASSACLSRARDSSTRPVGRAAPATPDCVRASDPLHDCGALAAVALDRRPAPTTCWQRPHSSNATSSHARERAGRGSRISLSATPGLFSTRPAPARTRDPTANSLTQTPTGLFCRLVASLADELDCGRAGGPSLRPESCRLGEVDRTAMITLAFGPDGRVLRRAEQHRRVAEVAAQVGPACREPQALGPARRRLPSAGVERDLPSAHRAHGPDRGIRPKRGGNADRVVGAPGPEFGPGDRDPVQSGREAQPGGAGDPPCSSRSVQPAPTS
jgi:hypothetical protein